MKTAGMNRREILVLGRNLFLTSLVAGLPVGCSISPAAADGGWQGNIRPVDGMGEATVKNLKGQAYAGSYPLSEGRALKSGEVVTVADGGRLVLSLPDRSVLQLKNKSQLRLDLDSKQGGDLTLMYGALLSVITKKRRSRHYRIKGAAAQVDVKGTVCFLQTFAPGEKHAKGIPEQATDYFCLCNGAIDYFNPAGTRKEKSISAEYHHAFFLYPENGAVGLIEAHRILNHDDREILSLIDFMEGEKYDTSWIEKYKNKYHY